MDVVIPFDFIKFDENPITKQFAKIKNDSNINSCARTNQTNNKKMH